MRPVTLRDARKVRAVPSVTTVLKMVDRAQLNDWRVEQGILAALTTNRREGESDKAFIERIVSDSQEQVRKAAAEGTRAHGACERLFRTGFVEPAYMATAFAVRDEVHRLFPGITDWVAERTFAHKLGFGGSIDLHSPSTGIVIDYKGKDGDFSDGKRLAYDQNWQLAGYHRGVELPRAPCANIFFSRTHPGVVTSYVWTADQIDDGWRFFSSLLPAWMALKNYYPMRETNE